MLRNYLKITARNIVKHRGYSLINITGLAVGIACCLLIFLYVKDELTYDRFHDQSDRIFRVTSTLTFAGDESTMGASGFPEGQAYFEGIPEVEARVRIDKDAAIVQLGDEFLQETALVYTDPELFEVFDFQVLKGTTTGALNDLNNLVITEDIAIKYFNTSDVVGETLRINVEDAFENYVIQAVIANHPSNSSFNFNMVLPWATRKSQLSDYRLNSWGNISINTFLLLNEAADVARVEAKMAEIRTTRNPGEDGEFARDIVNKLQPIAAIHLNVDYGGGDGIIAPTESAYSYILSGIALVILIVACINFTNLSVARSLPRAKEIGVRKVLGARRKQVAFQFLNEALIMCLVAFVLGLILAEMSLPVFGSLVKKTFYYGVTNDPLLILSCLLLVLLTAFLSGFYPAFVVSRFNTISSLKGKVRVRGKGQISRALVVVQFTIAAVLIVGTIAMNRQINYMVNMDLGYDDENLIRIASYGSGVKNLSQLFKDELAQNPNIVNVGAADNFNSGTGVKFTDHEYFSMYNDIDDRYPGMVGLELLEGRMLKKGRDRYIDGEDTLTNVLVNEAFVAESGLDDVMHQSSTGYRVVGVVKDFYYAGVKGEVYPLMMISADETGSQEFMSLFVKYKPDYLPQVMTTLSEAWRKFVPDRPFISEFVAEANANRYTEEARWKSIITYASALAIAISVMGLFGLAHLSTQQRIKEIGIRKVLGASVSQIVLMLNSNFARLVLVSVVLASPIAYYLIQGWLEDFANRIEIGVMLFLLPGLITFGVAFFTVSLQSVRSASANPIEALRYE